MSAIFNKSGAYLLLAALAVPATGSLSAQDVAAEVDPNILVEGNIPSDLSAFPEGPEVEGIISARGMNSMRIATGGGAKTDVIISDGTEIRGKGGFLGLGRTQAGRDALLNGLPVTVDTVQWEGGLIATRVRFKNDNLETAQMIHGGTEQQFAEHRTDIDKNTVATEALRSRMGDIDKYNIKGTTNVYFDTGKWALKPGAASELCNAAAEADAMDNALLLVVGYTDSVGDEDYNQVLSERRAGKVVNHLQQKCGWKPWRMISPTGMAESDPLADNDTAEGRAQNRRVSVNILVSKAVEGS